MADTSPVVDRPIEKNEPMGPKERARVPTLSFVAGVFLIIVILLSLITIISGKWLKSARTASGLYNEIGLWETCQCTDAWKTDSITGGTCSKYKSLILAVEAFSIIALGFEFFTVVLLFKDPVNDNKGLGHLATFFAIMALISLILTWAIFGGAFNKPHCGTLIRDFTTLGWAYGVRVAECALWFILTVILLLNSCGKARRNRTVFLLAFIIFALGIITTTGRGWVKGRPHVLEGFNNTVFEGGLWSNCYCMQNIDLYTTCVRRLHLIRAAEAFSVGAIVLSTFLLLLFYGWIPAAPKGVYIFVTLAAWAAQLLTWIAVGSFFARQYCHTRLRNGPEGYKLHWGFGIQVALSGLMIPVVIIAFIKPVQN